MALSSVNKKSAGILSAVAAALLAVWVLSPVKASDDSNKSLVKQTTFTIEQAESLAMSKFPEAKVEEIELDRDDSPLVWKIDMKMHPMTKIEFKIDAKSGEIIEQKVHKW